MTAESNMPPTTPMSLEDLQHWTQMLGRAQQMMLEQGIDLLERTPAIPDPTGMVKAQTDFWADTMKLWQRFLDPANAEPVEESPERARDKRFKAKQWHDDPLFAFIRQSYFLVADHMLKSVDALDGVEPKQKEQLRFATRGLIDAMSPTNFALLNPAVITETVFSWPGMGKAILDALVTKDFNVVMVCLMMLALLTVVFQLLTDLAYALVDPRIRYS